MRARRASIVFSCAEVSYTIGYHAGLYNSMFVGNYTNKVDLKGRVSLPAPYRKELGGEQQVLLMPAFTSNCLMGGNRAWAKGIVEEMCGNMPTPEQARRKRAVMGNMVALSVDANGRFILPEQLRAKFLMEDEAFFLGAGEYFEVWNVEEGGKALDRGFIVESEEGQLA